MKSKSLLLITPAIVALGILTECKGGNSPAPTPDPSNWQTITIDQAKTFATTNYAGKTAKDLTKNHCKMDCSESVGVAERATAEQNMQEIFGAAYTAGTLKCEADITSGEYFDQMKSTLKMIITAEYIEAMKNIQAEKLIFKSKDKQLYIETKYTISTGNITIDGKSIYNENGQQSYSESIMTAPGSSETNKIVQYTVDTFTY